MWQQIAGYFAKKLIDFMFRQKPEVVILFMVVFLLIGAVVYLAVRIENVERQATAEISLVRVELRDCQKQKDEISLKLAVLSAQVESTSKR